jgi:wobble nucleotide-excising tRNase
MIKKITSIDNFAVFDKFKWDSTVVDSKGTPLNFSDLNMLYGQNYSGKTTLSRIFRALETKSLPEKYENPHFVLEMADTTIIKEDNLAIHGLDIRVFNEDFIRAHLQFLIDPNGEIAPFAILGADNAKTEKAIAELEEKLGSNEEGNKSGLYKDYEMKHIIATTSQKKYNNEIEKLNKQLTDKAAEIKRNGKKFGDVVTYNITKINSDITYILSNKYTSLTPDKTAQYETALGEQAKSPVPKLNHPPLTFESYCHQVGELLKRKIGTSGKIDDLLHDAALNDWVKHGVELNKKREKCAFCNNPIADDRWKAIYAHFDEESKKLESDINTLNEEIEQKKKSLESAFNIDRTLFYSRYYDKIDDIISRFKTELQAYCEQLSLLQKQLDARKRQITVSAQIEAPVDNSRILEAIFVEFDAIRVENNDFSSQLEQSQKEAQKVLRLQEVENFCNTIRYAEVQQNIAKLKDETREADINFEQLKQQIQNLNSEVEGKRRQLNDEEEGARHVNKYLNDYFGHNFLSLQADKTTEDIPRIRFRIVRNGADAYNLSEGECSLIAFCYFMAKLDDVDTIGKRPIIWIDDPISSLDGNHVFFVYSLIRSEIVEKDRYKQLFISTHNLDFLKYLKRLTGKEKDKHMHYFLVSRRDKFSKIQVMPEYLKKYITEFNYLFHEIYKCSQIVSVDDSNYTTFYNFANNARKFLEILMYYYYPDDTKDIEKLTMFFGAGRVPALLTDRINNEYSHLSGIFERGATPTEVPEMLKTAQLIIQTLKEKNLQQYVSLLKSIGEYDVSELLNGKYDEQMENPLNAHP